jgi:hypothetical protein
MGVHLRAVRMRRELQRDGYCDEAVDRHIEEARSLQIIDPGSANARGPRSNRISSTTRRSCRSRTRSRPSWCPSGPGTCRSFPSSACCSVRSG